MSTIQQRANELARERRLDHALGEAYDPTADEAKPSARDKWCVYTLLKAGQIERQHRDAAEWLWEMIEKSAEPSAGWIGEAMGFRQTGFESAHENMMKRTQALREAEAAFQALTKQGYGRIARVAFEPLHKHGRPSVAQCAERADMETNGCRRRLKEMLEALSDYRDRIDADRQAHRERLEGVA
jgi:hypothetical protein